MDKRILHTKKFAQDALLELIQGDGLQWDIVEI